jgi:hypothetical protein
MTLFDLLQSLTESLEFGVFSVLPQSSTDLDLNLSCFLFRLGILEYFFQDFRVHDQRLDFIVYRFDVDVLVD